VSENKYLKSRLRSFRIALEGIKYVLITQQNARIHAVFTIIVILLAFVLRINVNEWVSLLLVIGLVWMAEIFNTAMEVMVDIVSPEHNEGAKVIKDISAGAVLIGAMISVLVGISIFGPKLYKLVKLIFN
jgi:diacylglycerol kinase (ATP)